MTKTKGNWFVNARKSNLRQVDDARLCAMAMLSTLEDTFWLTERDIDPEIAILTVFVTRPRDALTKQTIINIAKEIDTTVQMRDWDNAFKHLVRTGYLRSKTQGKGCLRGHRYYELDII